MAKKRRKLSKPMEAALSAAQKKVATFATKTSRMNSRRPSRVSTPPLRSSASSTFSKASQRRAKPYWMTMAASFWNSKKTTSF